LRVPLLASVSGKRIVIQRGCSQSPTARTVASSYWS
jgi:hypothetical protein